MLIGMTILPTSKKIAKKPSEAQGAAAVGNIFVNDEIGTS